MKRICPKCGFQNEVATGLETEACPQCGVIYSKLEKAPDMARRPPDAARVATHARPTHPPREMRLPLWSTVACVICLVFGFLAGREQMRYQIASAVTGAFAHVFDGVAKPAPPPTPVAVARPIAAATSAPEKPADVAKPAVIVPKLVKKGFREKDFSGSHYIKAAITFTVEFENEGVKDIRAFDGVLSFNDLLGNRIHGARLTISDPIKAGQSIQWQGEMEYNEFINEHTVLRGYSMNDVGLALTVGKILFADGTSQSLGDN